MNVTAYIMFALPFMIGGDENAAKSRVVNSFSLVANIDGCSVSLQFTVCDFT